jgi:NADH-quinone oxidoreductase subunit H
MGTGLCFSLSDIAAYQVANGSLITKLSMIPAAIAMMLVIPGETGNHPFDAAEAETELCEGMLAEYSGAPLGVYKLSHAIKMLTLTSMFVALFLGGLGTGIVILDAIILVAVCIVLTALCISLVHAVTARLKIEQIFKYYWTVVSGLALISLVLAWYGL